MSPRRKTGGRQQCAPHHAHHQRLQPQQYAPQKILQRPVGDRLPEPREVEQRPVPTPPPRTPSSEFYVQREFGVAAICCRHDLPADSVVFRFHPHLRREGWVSPWHDNNFEMVASDGVKWTLPARHITTYGCMQQWANRVTNEVSRLESSLANLSAKVGSNVVQLQTTRPVPAGVPLRWDFFQSAAPLEEPQPSPRLLPQ